MTSKAPGELNRSQPRNTNQRQNSKATPAQSQFVPTTSATVLKDNHILESESDGPPVPPEHETSGRMARDRLYIDEQDESLRKLYMGLQGAWQRVNRDLEEDHDPDYDSVEDDWWSYDELQARLRGFQFPERGNSLPKVVRWVSKEVQVEEQKKKRSGVPMDEVFENVGAWRKSV